MNLLNVKRCKKGFDVGSDSFQCSFLIGGKFQEFTNSVINSIKNIGYRYKLKKLDSILKINQS